MDASPSWSPATLSLIERARDEDLGARGDITAALLPEPDREVTAAVVPRAAGVVCGLALGPAVCTAFAERLEAPLEFAAAAGIEDGAAVVAGATVATVRGPLTAVLTVERTLLNFLGRMSGVASLTRRYVEAARATNPAVRVLDTRKTLPGWRELDKYAVRCGGGHNHRLGLHDAVLIKDNHLAACTPRDMPGRLAAVLFEMLNRLTQRPAFVEIEVDTLEQLDAVFKVVGIDAVLLDNFNISALREAVARRDASELRGRVALEASGGVTLENVAQIAATGVDRISVGAITHSAASLDLGLDLPG